MAIEKRCSKCTLVKPLTDFARHSAQRDGHQGHCKTCMRVYYRTYRLGHELQRRYGLTRSDVDQMFTVQAGLCAACSEQFPVHQGHTQRRGYHVDHCHRTKTVRGLLCAACNLALAIAKESPFRLRALADYVERFQISTLLPEATDA